MEQNNFFYSIIIPHYNIPILLRRCLSSIPKREDLQIIVVDDNSSQESKLQLEELEKEYNYVEFVYSEKNGGGGRARNIGLLYAKGKYILFADADDFFNYCIHDILEEYIEETCDVVFFNASYVDTDSYLQTTRRTTHDSAMKAYQKTKNINCLLYMSGEPWCKLVRRNMVEKNHIRFDETPKHNDTRFSYLVGYFSETYKVDERALYCLADRKASVSKKKSDDINELKINIFGKKNRFLADHGIHLFDNIMLDPFRYYFKMHDYNHLSKCYSVAAFFGFNKWFILRKLLIQSVIYRKDKIVKIWGFIKRKDYE